MRLCWFCGTEARAEGKIARKDTCPKCRMSVKCCKNCRFFETSAPRQCCEPAAEFVGDKEGANFCEYFDFQERSGRPDGNQGEKARSRFDSLFKK
ncbi:MAG: hypothetical protein HY049_05595 [Acidobacteria bacterium]|nr:hypothetical protein [Acidobacteriota bacterium]